MLKTIRARALNALWPALLGLMLSLGLLLPVLRALALDAAGTAVWACLLTAAVLAVAGYGGRVRWIALGAGAVMLLIYLIPGGGLFRIGGMLGAAVHLTRVNMEPLRVYSREVAALAGILLTIAGFAMAKQSAGFYPALSLTMIALLFIWFTGTRDALWMLAPCLIALTALYARSANEQTPYARVMMASALAVTVALGIAQTITLTSSTMENFAEKLRTFISDTLFFTDPRKVYSIQVDGYKPLETRLGGPVDLQNRPVMIVETPNTVLLRGVIMNEYNGLSWSDTLSTRRYLYGDPRHRSIRADIMDENRPAEAFRASSVMKTFDVRVTMASDSASTLFVSQRMEDLSTPMELVPYFNTSSEIFVTRNLTAGDSYSFSATTVNPNDPALPMLLAQAAASAPARDMSAYLRVPEHMADQVRQLVENIVSNHDTPLDIAVNIRDYLRNNFSYTLTPVTPPGDQDFVSYFLLRGKEGYCTYFASSMAVLGRLAGLPTRYVEGYRADPVDGVAQVTSKKAHAWAEVYFQGFGWIVFDATPGEGGGGSGNDGEGNANRPPDPTPTPPPDAPDGEEETQQPSSPSPTPSNAPESDDGGDTPQGGADDPTPSPSPTPTQNPNDVNNPDDAPTEEPDEGNDNSSGDNGDDASPNKPPKSRWWLWLFALLVIGLFVWRMKWTEPASVAARNAHNDGERLLVWYRALLGLLAASGLAARPAESPIQHALRIGESVPEDAALLAVADAVTLLGYGRYGASPAQVLEAQTCYQVLYKKAPLKAKLVWLWQRMAKGLGSIKQVP